MNSILAKRELARYAWAEGAEGLMLDGSGWLTEGIVSNLFFVRHGKLYTPSIETGILPGITREYVMRMAHKQGVGVEESFYRWDDLLQAEEIFITNSIQEIVPIHTVFDSQGDSQVVGQGEAGPITRKLIEQYKSKVGKS
jgi:4-amino-4-deoxychorismate lyase